MAEIKVIIKYPKCEARVTKVDNSLTELGKIVEGNIQDIWFPGNIVKEDVAILMNDRGKLIHMGPNVVIPEYGDILMGPIICAMKVNDIYDSIPDQLTSTIINYLNKHEPKEEPKRERDDFFSIITRW